MSGFVITPRSIIGTGDPVDIITMIPLLHSHGIQRACVMADETAEHCAEPIQRAVVVDHTDPPGVFQPGDSLGFCEPHFQVLLRGGRS